MSDMLKLSAYLRSAMREKERGLRRPALPFITLSRQAGAGGRTTAEAIRKESSRRPPPAGGVWHVFDDELSEAVAVDPKLSVLFRTLAEEEYRTSFQDMLARGVSGLSSQGKVWAKVFETLRGLAQAGRVILIGRGARWVTRDIPCGVHLRLVAPKGLRTLAVAARYRLDHGPAARKLEELDASRRRLVRHRFSRDIDDPLQYDAVLNTGVLSAELVAKLAADLASERAAQAAEPAAA